MNAHARSRHKAEMELASAAQAETVWALLAALEAREDETSHHSQRVVHYATAIAQARAKRLHLASLRVCELPSIAAAFGLTLAPALPVTSTCARLSSLVFIIYLILDCAFARASAQFAEFPRAWYRLT